MNSLTTAQAVAEASITKGTPSKAFIYALVDPRNSQTRYIGKSVDPLTRLRQHWARPHGRLELWLSELRAQNKYPTLNLLEECAIEDWADREREYIAKGRALGWPLLNICDGGQGFSMGFMPESTRVKVGAKSKAAWQKPGYREKMRAAMKAGHTPEGNQRIREARAGKPMPEATRKKISQALRHREVSAETRAKLRAANIGREHTLDTRAKLADIGKQRLATNPVAREEHYARLARMAENNRGRRDTPETRAKKSAALRGRKKSPEAIEAQRLSRARNKQARLAAWEGSAP